MLGNLPAVRLAADEHVGIAELADERWITPPEGLTSLEEIQRVCAAAGFPPKVDSYSYTYTGVLSLVGAGLGVALVPAMALPPEGTLARLVARPIADVQAVCHVFAALRRGTQSALFWPEFFTS